MATHIGGFLLTVFCAINLAWRVSADACDSNPCQNEGRCFTYSWSKKYHCDCTRPYFGTSCEKESPCVSGNPCRNGGSCRASSYSPGYRCNCPSTHVGKNCQIENPCLKNHTLCQNGGTCYDSRWRDEGYFCSCPSGYGGNNCQIRSLCDENPCMNGGSCRDNFWDKDRIYRCTCPEDYEGDNCEFADPCHSSPCENGGSCFSHMSYSPVQKYDYYCRCSSMYHGKHCQHASECQTKVCYNGGTCYTWGDGKASCNCAAGFRGPTCQQKTCSVRDTCRSRHWGETYDFANCTAYMRNFNVGLKTCALTHYEEVKELQSCDCVKEDVSESIRRLYADSAQEEARCLYKTSQEELESCSEETMACISVFRQVFRGPARECNETTKDIMLTCIDRYERGSLDLSNCAPGKTMLKMAQIYKQYITMTCAECYHWEIGRNCSILEHSGSALDYICSLYENGEEIMQCMLQEAEQVPRCRPLRNNLPGLLRAQLNTLNSQYGEACREYANYQTMWREDWGCNDQSDMSIKRSLAGQMDPWAMF